MKEILIKVITHDIQQHNTSGLSMSRQRDFSRKVTNSGLEPGRLGSETSDLPILLTKSLLGNEYNKNVDTSLGFDSQKEFTLALEDSKIEDAEGPSPCKIHFSVSLFFV